ncbi:protoporphyrin IX magnesium-chelatase [Dongia mobilis]|uniref:Protoporphyrin IX magnesium-chelatase n=1 Tax=Dongia mobilis TaxID=578943 RepID=A0A4R6WP17_9PROT|nr:magnesium chelatase subunit D [Dongia mobilis]TDQ82924.1 protoporphyrin IX magnesium-chelatase [Dongia mobilis]
MSASDAVLAAALLAIDPSGLGGIRLLAAPGPARDRWLSSLDDISPADTPCFRLPSHVGEDRLLGGLDLAATLRAGRPIAESGLLTRANGGFLIATMAERMRPVIAAHLAVALDRGEVVVERDGFSRLVPTRIAVIALDEGIAGDEAPPEALTDRLGLVISLDGVKADGLTTSVERATVSAARRRLVGIRVTADNIEILCAAALALGIWSLRMPAFALAAARAHAALRDADSIEEADLAAAARLVLAPRATTAPAEATEVDPPEQPDRQEEEVSSDSADGDSALADRVLAAAAASIPPGLLARLTQRGVQQKAGPGGRAGAQIASRQRGRPAGILSGVPRGGLRLSVIDTLRAAAPWQRLRETAALPGRRIVVKREDLRLVRRRQRSETVTIFAVDASGSTALHRLAEAKGAVELLLAECYVRRDEVALIAFRGRGAELLLPPTRSLVRARRALADLPGGGGTPLASAIAAMTALAESSRRRGKSPLVVLLTDGRANVARDGSGGRAQAETDALAAARMARTAGLSALLVDTSPAPTPAAQRLALEVGAQYLPLPYADASAIARTVQAAATRRGAA